MNQQKRQPRKRKNSDTPTENYFTIDHENAILSYCATQDLDIRTEMYEKFIQPAFDLMVDKIVYTHKFNTLPNIDELRKDCKIWLITVLDKFDPSKGSKAFSYFSVITKNWFIHKVNFKKTKKEVCLDDSIQELETNSNFFIYNSYEEDVTRHQFHIALTEEINRWSNMVEKDVDQVVYVTLLNLFKDSHTIEIFNKKAIYLYMREVTGLSTKQIVGSLKKFKEEYKHFRRDWDNDEIDV